ncbi:MAG: aminomethyl transferase family protein [Desulfobacterales bacterium]|nr:aminomethyl transferase family protein [Desulfobacterales bacterium]
MSRKTPLHRWHLAHNAKMADFGGYEMPLWYSSVKQEHLSVLTSAGLFDTSHMAVVLVSGPGAEELLQHCFTQDLNACIGRPKKPLTAGRCVYGAFLTEDGGVSDDAIVYLLQQDRYMVVVNAGMGDKIAAHLKKRKAARAADIEDLTDQVGKIDLQGPGSGSILRRLLPDADSVLAGMVYFSFKGSLDQAAGKEDRLRLVDGTPVLLSRTGYTGEFGFEIFLPPERTAAVWETLLEAGQAHGAIPCGLAARDSLRAGALLPLSHQDIGPWPYIRHPWEFALPFAADRSGFTKDFVGRLALETANDAPHTHPFVGDDLRKVSASEPAVVVDADGNEMGVVLTCATDVGIGWQGGRILSVASPDAPENFRPRGLSCGFVKVASRLTPGDVVNLRDSRRVIRATIATDVRPGRTARRPVESMIQAPEEVSS